MIPWLLFCGTAFAAEPLRRTATRRQGMVREDKLTRLVAETKLQLPRTSWRSSRKIPCLERFPCGRFYEANSSFYSEHHPVVRAASLPTLAVRTELPPGQRNLIS